jgi:hypothetical protein
MSPLFNRSAPSLPRPRKELPLRSRTHLVEEARPHIWTIHQSSVVALLSAEEYQRLRQLDRRAMHVSELTDEDLAALDAVEIPAEATRYNHEMT